MTEQQNERVIEPSHAGARENGNQSGAAVIDPLRAPARDDHAEWRSDATKTVGQLVAEGVDRKEAQRRVQWARRQLKREEEAAAFIEELVVKRAARRNARLSGAFEAPIPADTRRWVSKVDDDGTEGSS